MASSFGVSILSMHVLYISYDGILEPLGQSQVLAYVRRLAISYRMTILSYEKPDDWNDAARRKGLRNALEKEGIAWHPLPYHRRFSILATTWDVLRGLALCRRLIRQNRVDIVHARSYVASLIALSLKQRFGARFVFDMRGFWPDEKVDAGSWSRASAIYRVAKSFERKFLTSADAVVSLTHAGVAIMREFLYLRDKRVEFTVIPTCADLKRFCPGTEPKTGPFTLGYVGNASGWYRFEPVVSAFQAIRQQVQDARLLIINSGQSDFIHRHLDAQQVPRSIVEIAALNYSDVPDAMRRMDATAFFIAPTYSKQASAPTKLAEFLGSGVPCLVNYGVGDMGPIIRDNGVGIVVDSMDSTTVAGGARGLIAMARDSAVQGRCVQTAKKFFSLDTGVAAYDGIYQRLRSSTQGGN